MAAGPFRTVGETSEEARQSEGGEKRKTSEREKGCGEEEASVVEGNGGAGSGFGEVGLVKGGHLGFSRPRLEIESALCSLQKKEDKEWFLNEPRRFMNEGTPQLVAQHDHTFESDHNGDSRPFPCPCPKIHQSAGQ